MAYAICRYSFWERSTQNPEQTGRTACSRMVPERIPSATSCAISPKRRPAPSASTGLRRFGQKAAWHLQLQTAFLLLPLCFLDASCHASLSDHPGRRRMRGLTPSPREGTCVLAMHLRLSRTPSVPRTIRSAGLPVSGIAALLHRSAYQRLKHADAFFYPVPHGGNDGLGMADVRVCLRMDRKPLSPRTSMAEPDRPRRYPPGKLPA